MFTKTTKKSNEFYKYNFYSEMRSIATGGPMETLSKKTPFRGVAVNV